MRRIGPSGMLVASVAALSTFQVPYAATGVPPSAAATLLTSYGLALAFILWVADDARSRRCVPCFDFGFLVAVFFPASLVWYVLWSRGRRGMTKLVALFALMLLPWLFTVVTWLVRHDHA